MRVTHQKCAEWATDERKAIHLLPEHMIAPGHAKEDWVVRQSGYAGPLVLQLQT